MILNAKTPSTMFSMIVAQSKNGVIGVNNTLPWHLSADLQYFKKMTMGKPILMGRKTYESIGKPLPGREMLVLSSQPNLKIEGCRVFSSLEDFYEYAKNKNEVVITGGAQIYKMFMPIVDTLYVTEVDTDIEGDAHFPAIDSEHWEKLTEKLHQKDEKNEYNYRFITYRRKPA